MRILHFIETEGMYGAENVVLNLSKMMEKKSRYEPVIGCIVQNDEEKVQLIEVAQSLGLQTKKFKIRNYLVFLDIFRSVVQMKRLGIVLIHSHGYKPSVIGFCISQLSKIPIVATCHLRFFGNKSTFRLRLLATLEVYLYKYFSKIISVSSQLKEYLISKGINCRHIEIVRNGISVTDYCVSDINISSMDLREIKYGNSFVILNIGRLCEQKAQKNIILACKQLIKKNLQISVIICGDGNYKQMLQDMVKTYGLNNNVNILGFRNDIKELFHIADLFLLTSLDEGLPICILEAMASKVPIVATNVGGIPEILENDKDCILIHPNDISAISQSIQRLYFDNNLCKKYSDNAYRKVVQYFSIESMYDGYNRIYNEIIVI